MCHTQSVASAEAVEIVEHPLGAPKKAPASDEAGASSKEGVKIIKRAARHVPVHNSSLNQWLTRSETYRAALGVKILDIRERRGAGRRRFR